MATFKTKISILSSVGKTKLDDPHAALPDITRAHADVARIHYANEWVACHTGHVTYECVFYGDGEPMLEKHD